mgnify:CR=1 FL=1
MGGYAHHGDRDEHDRRHAGDIHGRRHGGAVGLDRDIVEVVVPEGALTGPVSVTNPIGTAPSAASFKVLPKITDVTPLSAVGGSADGDHGERVQPESREATTPGVKIGAFVVPPASITSSATQLTFPVPLGAVTGKVTVTTADGSATSAATLTVRCSRRSATSFRAGGSGGWDAHHGDRDEHDRRHAGDVHGRRHGGADGGLTATSLKVVVPGAR